MFKHIHIVLQYQLSKQSFFFSTHNHGTVFLKFWVISSYGIVFDENILYFYIMKGVIDVKGAIPTKN